MYYKLTNAIEKVGVYPQVTEEISQYSILDFMRANRELDPFLNNTIPPASELIIRPGAKVTDALSLVATSWPFLTVSEKLLHFLQSVRIDPLRVLPTIATKKGIPYSYWFVVIDKRRPEYVDYQASRFTIITTHDHTNLPTELSISDAEEYNDLFQQYGYSKYIHATKLVLATAAIKHDIFRLPHFTDPCYFVSERFREAVEKENITGLRFDPAELAV